MHIQSRYGPPATSGTERALWAGGHGVLVLAGLSLVSGYWAVLLALGPAAYLMVLDAHGPENAPVTVVTSCVAASMIGWIAYPAIAQGISPMAVEPMSEAGVRVLGSAVVAFAATTGAFYLPNIEQPMAYVAAFTAAVGVLQTVASLLVAIAAVLIMAGMRAVRRRYGLKLKSRPGALVNGRPKCEPSARSSLTGRIARLEGRVVPLRSSESPTHSAGPIRISNVMFTDDPPTPSLCRASSMEISAEASGPDR